MTLMLGPKAEELIRAKLASGQYASVEDLVMAALEALEQQAQDDFAPGELDELIATGEESAKKHGWIPAEKVFQKLEDRSRQRRSGKA